MPQLVPPDGDPNSKIAIIGARPAADEIRTGRAYTGPTGEKLWRWLGIPRNECYVTNVRKDYAPNADPTDKEIKEVLPDLRRELEQIHPNVLILIGPAALKAVCGRSGITNWRGSILESTLVPGIKCIPTLQPAAADTTYSLRYVIDLDLRRARRESAYPDIRRPKRTFYINPPLDEAIALLRSLSNPISVDIETLGDTVSVIGISDDPSRAICFGLVGSHYSTSELITILREVDVVLRSRDCQGQNFQFDTTRLERLGFKIPRITFDTMLAHHLLWTELGSGVKRKQGDKGIDSLTGKHSLAFLTSVYTDEPFYKWESDAAWAEPDLELGERFWRYWTYNCKDCCVTQEIAVKLRQELIQYDQLTYYNEHVLSLIRPIMRMQDRGLSVDLTRLNQIRRRLELEAGVLQCQLNQAVGFDCNVRSGLDLKYLLVDVLKQPILKRTKKGAVSTDEDTLRTLAYKGEHTEIFRLILDIRERRTLCSSFLNLETDQGRYKASYLIHGTDSGRLSSRAVGKGPQLQNIPKSTRKVFIPDRGSIFIEGDLSRAEAMYAAYDAEELDLIALFEDSSRDLYIEVAANSLRRPVVKGSIERDCFKQVVLGSNYKMGPIKLSTVLGLKGIDILKLDVPGASRKAKADYVQGIYFKRYPGIPKWQTTIEREIRRTRQLIDPFGRRHCFLGRMDDGTTRAALSRKPQSTVVGITNRAIRMLDAAGWNIVAQVHDAVMIECPASQRDDAAIAIRDAMTCPLTIHGRTMVIPVDIKWSDVSWGEMHDWEGPGS